MKVALTGATGYIGSHVLTELGEHGHEVTALVRDDTGADSVAARGAKPAVVDLYDRPAGPLSRAAAANHAVLSPGRVVAQQSAPFLPTGSAALSPAIKMELTFHFLSVTVKARRGRRLPCTTI